MLQTSRLSCHKLLALNKLRYNSLPEPQCPPVRFGSGHQQEVGAYLAAAEPDGTSCLQPQPHADAANLQTEL